LADSPPTLIQYSHWGRRIDQLQTSEGWRRLKEIAIEEGLVSISYERRYGEWSRVYAFAKALLFTGEGRVVGCPISMTDGCARVLELLGTPEMQRTVMERLITSDSVYAFTSGQFMTERPGGSDVSLTETVARPVEGEPDCWLPGAKYRLTGFKWFSSATDSQVALALARTGDPSQGSRTLSLFLLPLRLPLPDPEMPTPSDLLPRTNDLADGEPINNGIEIHRLKSKIGTHALPTAELSLNNSLAYLVGPLNGGVKAISPVLQITRLHSAFHSVGNLARALGIATSFAKVRQIDGGRRVLVDVPLHMSTLASVAVTYRALLSFALSTAHLLGQVEDGGMSEESFASVQARFRLLNPTLKAFAAHHAVPAMEECMAALGGQGYMEETGIGRLIRDALVERIWEGTENVLALDLVRATVKGGSAMVGHWTRWATAILRSAEQQKGAADDGGGGLRTDGDHQEGIRSLKEVVLAIPAVFEEMARHEGMAHLSLLLFGHSNAALYLLEHAVWADRVGEAEAPVHWDAFARWTVDGGVRGVGLPGLLARFDRSRGKAGPGRAREDRAIVCGGQFQPNEKSKL